MKKLLFSFAIIALLISSCKKDEDPTPEEKVFFYKYKVDGVLVERMDYPFLADNLISDFLVLGFQDDDHDLDFHIPDWDETTGTKSNLFTQLSQTNGEGCTGAGGTVNITEIDASSNGHISGTFSCICPTLSNTNLEITEGSFTIKYSN